MCEKEYNKEFANIFHPFIYTLFCSLKFVKKKKKIDKIVDHIIIIIIIIIIIANMSIY